MGEVGVFLYSLKPFLCCFYSGYALVESVGHEMSD